MGIPLWLVTVKEQEDVTWTGLGDESMEEVIITIDRNDESDSTNKGKLQNIIWS